MIFIRVDAAKCFCPADFIKSIQKLGEVYFEQRYLSPLKVKLKAVFFKHINRISNIDYQKSVDKSLNKKTDYKQLCALNLQRDFF